MPPRFLPLKTGTFRWGSAFRTPARPSHNGIDFEANDGTPIYAAQGGTVQYIGPAQGFGQWIVIDHPAEDGSGTTVYGHMWNAHATGLQLGQRVEAGQLIAYVGSNGQSTGPHLHFEVHPTVWRPGSQIDPAPWLRGALEPGATPTPKPEVPAVGWTGDPIWLADVVRPAVSKFVEYPGWRNRGHGDFKDIRGVMVHHMGGRGAARTIAEGRSDLPGPLSQFHIAQDGTVTVVAVGVAWHAGVGSYPWLPTNMGNWHLIGIECEGPVTPGITQATEGRERWPDAEVIALRNLCAALLGKLQLGTDRLIGHKDYAGRAQGKWDPWNMSMDWLRGEVAKDMSGFVFPGEGTPTTTPPPVRPPVPPVDAYRDVLLFRGMSGPAIVTLQQRLKRAYSKLVVDGDFGAHTEACVRDYQRLHPPLAVDGIVGPATAASLKLPVLAGV